MINRRICVTKIIVSNIISNGFKNNYSSYIEKMCFVNWRFRSFVQYVFYTGRRPISMMNFEFYRYNFFMKKYHCVCL